MVSLLHSEMAAHAALVARRCLDTNQSTELGKSVSDSESAIFSIILSVVTCQSLPLRMGASNGNRSD